MAGPGIALDKAYLSAIWLETMFYGERPAIATCLAAC